MSSTTITTFTPPTSLAATNLPDLPFELIWAILDQCDDYLALHALRRTCKTFRWYIDNNPSFDKFLFRHRPLTNPALTRADLRKIRSLAQTEEEEEEYEDNPWLSEDNPYIKVHPILSRIGWHVDEHAMFIDDDDVYIVGSGLKTRSVPHILDECATCPPVFDVPTSIFEVDLELGYYAGYYEPNIFQHDLRRIFTTDHDRLRPVLFRDVISRLIQKSKDLHQRCLEDNARKPITPSTDIKIGSPRVKVLRKGLWLCFDFQCEFAICERHEW
ncbi:unnamed protein product [Tilletia controversa]|nr:unnamed protein product [Tilletia controversa]